MYVVVLHSRKKLDGLRPKTTRVGALQCSLIELEDALLQENEINICNVFTPSQFPSTQHRSPAHFLSSHRRKHPSSLVVYTSPELVYRRGRNH
jgi:hypothetical protein